MFDLPSCISSCCLRDKLHLLTRQSHKNSDTPARSFFKKLLILVKSANVGIKELGRKGVIWLCPHQPRCLDH